MSNAVLSSSQHLLTHTKKIVCIGRNYAEHAKELGNAIPSAPFFFLKPTTSLIRSGSNIGIPSACIDHSIHHEIEVGVVIGKTGKNIGEEQAMSMVRGYVLALDMTDRTLQDAAKKAGKPWTAAKGGDTWCPISDSMVSKISPNARLWCKVNGVIRQDDSISKMTFKIPQLISCISSVMTLEENDVILTGTPSGVGPVVPGDAIEGGLDDDNDKTVLSLKFDVVAVGS